MKFLNKKTTVFLCICLVCSVILIIFSGNDKTVIKDESIQSIKTYENMIESRLTTLISSFEGVSDVNVMVIVKSGIEYLYAQNTEENEGGIRRQYYNTGDRDALMLKELSPEFSGVAVVCNGGDDPVTKQKIIELISSITGLTANRIYVGV